MPNIAFFEKMIKNSLESQAVLVEGVHGIGKSSVISNISKKLGYEVITIFLGQKADPGDIIGLPHKYQVEISGVSRWVTTFAEMDWWPKDPTKKYVIFFDEINRASSSMRQCVMDLVLNRSMNGKSLPEHTRIFAAINPSTEGNYQVDDLDPALLDRFNVYVLEPTTREWLNYAIEFEFHDAVVGFISNKGDDCLDPPSQIKEGTVYPSRRSWERLSDNLKAFPDILSDLSFLQTYANGFVGTVAAKKLRDYIQTLNSKINGELVLLEYSAKMEKEIKELNQTEQISIVHECVNYFNKNITKFEKEEEFTSDPISKRFDSRQDWALHCCTNLEQYLKVCLKEVSAVFFKEMQNAHSDKKKWPHFIASTKPDISKNYRDTIRGQ